MGNNKYFEGLRVRVFNFGPFKKGACCYIPYLGIIVGKDNVDNKHLLRHEFGHYLQRKEFGLWKFLRYFAIDSILSYRKSKSKEFVWFRHYDTWTEWSANRMAWEYFKRPADWDHAKHPININVTREGCVIPPELRNSFTIIKTTDPTYYWQYA